MPLPHEIQESVRAYVDRDLPDPAWYARYFSFIDDAQLSERLAKEFMAIRYIYKLFEGLGVSETLLMAEVRVQIVLYASIYEAILHHLLFGVCSNRDEVRRLREQVEWKRISVRKDLDLLMHDKRRVYTMYRDSNQKKDITKIRFDQKAEAATQLGIIDSSLKRDLIAIYGYRNAIHIQAELRKDVSYDLDVSKTAYRRMQLFRKAVIEWLDQNGLLPNTFRAP